MLTTAINEKKNTFYKENEALYKMIEFYLNQKKNIFLELVYQLNNFV